MAQEEKEEKEPVQVGKRMLVETEIMRNGLWFAQRSIQPSGSHRCCATSSECELLRTRLASSTAHENRCATQAKDVVKQGQVNTLCSSASSLNARVI